MTVAWIFITFCSLGIGFVLGLMWGPFLMKKKYKKIFDEYKVQVEATKTSQEKITEEYLQTLQGELHEYLFAMTGPPPPREDMN